MAIQCPYCLHTMDVKGAKPGRFAPHCPSCKRKFLLVIPDDQRREPVVAAMPDRKTEKLDSAIETALGLEPPPSARQDQNNKERESGGQPRNSSATVTTPPPRRETAPSSSSAGATTPPPRNVERTQPLPPRDRRIESASGVMVTSVPPNDGHHGPRPAQPPAPQSESTIADNAPAGADGQDLSGRIGGYEIIYRLGRGGMGSVYLARQLSLDRNVAVKTLLQELAEDPSFVARFTREAYAAAQLVHHNVVQIYDIGEQKRTHFFSMEFIEGKTIAQLIKERGKIDPDEAVGYVIQAARGLRFAHEHGMVHRDIKPENLMVNRHGMVKVADLGLVKVPPTKGEVEAERAKKAAQTGRWYDSGTTDFNVSMGTPAYMPPEQATNAASVDHRADIYALGCTLYAMLAGRPPFEGHTAQEVITKHLREPITPPNVVVQGVGPNLSAIIMKMTAKKPEDRYQSMDEVIQALEDVIGVRGSVELTPDEEQVKALQNCVSWFNNASLAKVRRTVIRAFFPLCGLLTIVAMFAASGLNKFLWVGGLLGFTVLTPLFYEIFKGVEQKTILWIKGRAFLFGMRVKDWIVGGVLLAVACLVLSSLQLAWPIIMFALAATLAGYAFYAAFDKPLLAERKKPIDSFENILRQMRGKGISEAAIQQFVCKYGTEHWEEFFEALFGYEAKKLAREKWGTFRPAGQRVVGDRGRLRPKFAAWRDPIIHWIDQKLELWQAQRDKAYLEKIEIARLRAKGYADLAAKKNARRLAESLVMRAADIREDAKEESMETLPPPPPPAPPKDQPQPGGSATAAPQAEPVDRKKPKKQRARRRTSELRMPDSVDEGQEDWEHLSYVQRRYGGYLGFIFNPTLRLVLGAVLVVGCIMWMRQNGLATPGALAQLFKITTENVDLQEGANIRNISDAVESTGQQIVSDAARATDPLRVQFLPDFVTAPWYSFTAGIAGAILILSTLFSGALFGALVVTGSLLMVLGKFFGVPPIGSATPETVSVTLGVLLCVIAFVWGRR